MNPGGNFTRAEILSQTRAWQEAQEAVARCEAIPDVIGGSTLTHHVLFTGCGSTYYLSLAAAAHLVADADPSRVRRCAASDCGAWFLDTSKGGRRKWCSMAACGNRAKAARHRRKGRSG